MSKFLGAMVYANLACLSALLARLTPGERSYIARRAMRDRHAPRVRLVAGFCNNAVLAWKNKLYDVDKNGEAQLLARLAPFGPKVVFDVGANVGDWALAACEVLPTVTVHAFEICERTASELKAATARLPPGRVVVNDVGLSDHEGEVTIYASEKDSTATTMRRDAVEVGAAQRGAGDVEELRARVTAGDTYLERAGIARVDLLKIDAEGAEPQVLKGFEGAFARGAIDMVQFEYGAINAVTRFLLADFHAFFEARGFAVGKIYPEGVDFRPYEPADEDFAGPNFLACRRERTDLIEALRGPELRFA